MESEKRLKDHPNADMVKDGLSSLKLRETSKRYLHLLVKTFILIIKNNFKNF